MFSEMFIKLNRAHYPLTNTNLLERTAHSEKEQHMELHREIPFLQRSEIS